MRDGAVVLGKREQQIVELLLQGCDNGEISEQLKMARRTVKAHFNRLFLRFGITTGIKRVKLATLLYRRQLCLQSSVTEHATPAKGSTASSNSLPKDSRTPKSPLPWEPQSTSSKIIFASSTISSDSGTESNLPSGTKLASTKKRSTPNVLEAWERSLLGPSASLVPGRTAAK
jgi:Bacterial regulatory proteins, luxR family